MAMDGVEAMSPPNHPLIGATVFIRNYNHIVDVSFLGFNWASLPDGATVVDVGGGSGTIASKIAGAHPKLRFVVQDLPSIVEKGKMVKACKFADGVVLIILLATRRSGARRAVEISGYAQCCILEAIHPVLLLPAAHDFFEPNPVKNPDVFMMKRITHDWSDANVKKILQHLRDAAGTNTRLVSADRIVPYSCPIPEGHVATQISGIIKPSFPPPVTVAFSDNLAYKASVLVRCRIPIK